VGLCYTKSPWSDRNLNIRNNSGERIEIPELDLAYVLYMVKCTVMGKKNLMYVYL
jgi:hypothetical protein